MGALLFNQVQLHCRYPTAVQLGGGPGRGCWPSAPSGPAAPRRHGNSRSCPHSHSHIHPLHPPTSIPPHSIHPHTHIHPHSIPSTRIHPHIHIYTHTTIHTSIYTSTYILTHPYTHIHTLMHTHPHTHPCTYTHTHTSILTHTSIHIHPYTYMHTFTHTHRSIHTQIHAHTHIHTQGCLVRGLGAGHRAHHFCPWWRVEVFEPGCGFPKMDCSGQTRCHTDGRPGVEMSRTAGHPGTAVE